MKTLEEGKRLLDVMIAEHELSLVTEIRGEQNDILVKDPNGYTIGYNTIEHLMAIIKALRGVAIFTLDNWRSTEAHPAIAVAFF